MAYMLLCGLRLYVTDRPGMYNGKVCGNHWLAEAGGILFLTSVRLLCANSFVPAEAMIWAMYANILTSSKHDATSHRLLVSTRCRSMRQYHLGKRCHQKLWQGICGHPIKKPCCHCKSGAIKYTLDTLHGRQNNLVIAQKKWLPTERLKQHFMATQHKDLRKWFLLCKENLLRVLPNREVQGLGHVGWISISLNNKACWLTCNPMVHMYMHIHIYMYGAVTTWNFVYKADLNYTCAMAKQSPKCRLDFAVSWRFFDILSGHWYEFALQLLWYACCSKGVCIY